MTRTDQPLRVALLCSGLDHAQRGFESFAREAFDVLREDPALDVALLKGSGPDGDRERAVRTLTRDTRLAQALGRATGREPFRLEQAAFGLSVAPRLLRSRPDVVYFSEWHTGLVLAAVRLAARVRLPLVLCNGTMAVEGFGHLDRVQELTPAALDEVLARGGDPARHVQLPLGFAIPERFDPVTAEDRAALRRRVGLPADRVVVMSSAALNRHHKRLDALIEEVARLPQPRPHLLLAGQPEAETPGIIALARERLGADGYDVRTVPQREVPDLLRAADVFVLASFGEGLPRALIEALAHGLPCVVHDYPVTRYALAEHGTYGDLRRPGTLARLLAAHAPAEIAPERQRARHRSAFERFGWEALRPAYVGLLRGAA